MRNLLDPRNLIGSTDHLIVFKNENKLIYAPFIYKITILSGVIEDRYSQNKHHLVRLSKSGKCRFSINVKLGIIGIIVYLFIIFFRPIFNFNPQTYYFACFIKKNSNLISMIITNQFTAFNTNMILTIIVY